MDLFRYFHPHHNPRLRSKALRAQELGELELAALELQRALERARVRTHAAELHAASALTASATSVSVPSQGQISELGTANRPESPPRSAGESVPPGFSASQITKASIGAKEELTWEQLSFESNLSRRENGRKSPKPGRINSSHFEELLVAANYLVESLTTLAKAHPGDSEETIQELLRERQDAPGWEAWSRLLLERLKMIA